jgi:hypothetical protein
MCKDIAEATTPGHQAAQDMKKHSAAVPRRPQPVRVNNERFMLALLYRY